MVLCLVEIVETENKPPATAPPLPATSSVGPQRAAAAAAIVAPTAVYSIRRRWNGRIRSALRPSGPATRQVTQNVPLE